MTSQAATVIMNDAIKIINGSIHRVATPTRGESYSELAQDCAVSAIEMLTSADKAGKTVSPNTLAFYALQRSKSGRRAYPFGSSRSDILSPGFQLDHPGVLFSMDDKIDSPDSDDAPKISEILPAKQDDPSSVVGRALDWEEFLNTQNDRNRTVIREIARGVRPSEIARALSVSKARISQLLRQIGDEIKKHMGTDILSDVTAESVWERDLRILRGKEAYRYQKS